MSGTDSETVSETVSGTDGQTDSGREAAIAIAIATAIAIAIHDTTRRATLMHTCERVSISIFICFYNHVYYGFVVSLIELPNL